MNNKRCQAIRPFSTIGSVDAVIDALSPCGSTLSVTDRQKMGQSKRRVEEGGFEGGGVGIRCVRLGKNRWIYELMFDWIESIVFFFVFSFFGSSPELAKPGLGD